MKHVHAPLQPSSNSKIMGIRSRRPRKSVNEDKAPNDNADDAVNEVPEQPQNDTNDKTNNDTQINTEEQKAQIVLIDNDKSNSDNPTPLVEPQEMTINQQMVYEQQNPIQTFNVYNCINVSKKLKAPEFTFLQNNKNIYRAVAERLISPSKFDVINCQTNSLEVIIQISKRRSVFELILNDEKKNCICATKIHYNGEETDIRHVEFAAYDNEMKEMCHLFEKPPTRSRDGKLTLAFGGKIVVPSTMNVILRTPDKYEELIGVRLIANNTLEIDTKLDLFPLHILTLAVASMYAQ
ncbi:hypothetical protein TRFO_20937 [Tritrichomonas foetus]|uniref:Tubby C-terminal domain-containing protein n=1 Tax=Tritrichomonas foetus TaxID=1144522 RepID=A0A1J4KKW7_9EUKA|nr:hypothetical protein TRFO_20937 [Tritrichomonas foetus]|eukprot:OHT10021.1 hypothetical protein TRFO_20937 [Tritrichomonas foetus]